MSLSRAVPASYSARSRARARRSGVTALAVSAAALALVPAAPAPATGSSSSSPSFVCAADTVYSLDQDDHRISRINPTTGATSSNGKVLSGNDDAVNALALPSGGGRYIYAFNRSDNEVVRFDATTNDEDSDNAPPNPSASSVIAGAINPATGIYYYAAGGSPWKLYAFKTSTNTAIGQVGTIAGLAGNGDMAFDAVGNLYVVSNTGPSAAGTLARVNGPLPTTAGSTAFASTPLATLPHNSGRYAAMAFDGSGLLVVGTDAGKVLRVNPSSGALVSTRTVDLTLSDMASCSTPSTASVRVDLPAGRHSTGDQFDTTITGNGVSSGNSGVTAGNDAGLQTQDDEVAGPVVVLPGTQYTITQTAAGGTDLGDYTTTWKCVKGSDNSTVASGAGGSGTFTTPSTSGSTVVCTFTNVPLLPALGLDKVAGPITDVDGNGPDAGDTVTYTFTVTNVGNVALDPVAVSDPKVGPVACPSGSLAVGASRTCGPKTYALTQADVNAGRVENTATASGTATNGVRVTDTDSATVLVPALPGIEIDKTADGTGSSAGDPITYGFKVTNTGNVVLTAVAVSDPKLGGAVTCPAGPLAPGASVTCTPRTYPLTQPDVNAGRVDNTATATGMTPSGSPVSDTDSTTTALQGTAAIELVKAAGAIKDVDGNGPDAGDTIGYGFTVTNVGTVTLTAVAVSDPRTGAVTCPSGPLTPGAHVSCTAAAYPLTQADVDAGRVDNTATVTGTPPTGSPVTDTDSTSTPVPVYPAVELDKMAGAVEDVDGNGPDAGDTIGYGFEVTNTGNVTLKPVTVSDPRLGGAIACPAGALAPGEKVACTAAAYALTQTDVDAGHVDNTATAGGTPPTGSTVTDTDSTSTPVAPAAGIELMKAAGAVNDVNGNGIDDGDTITYTFEVTNTGNVTLTNITVADPKAGPVSCPTAPLAPGSSLDCDPRTYTLTQADVDHGSVDNTAEATGTTPGGDTVTDDDSRTVELPATGAIQLVKTAGDVVDLDGNGPDAGDSITYSFRVTNTGNVKLNPVTVNDPNVGPVTCPAGGLEPDEAFDCADVAYTITQADADTGKVDNTATATGATPDGGTVQDTDSTTTPVQPSVTNVRVAKSVDDTTPRVGDTITYTLAVTNTGAAHARDVVVVDALPTGVTFVSADAPCARSGSTVRCAIGTVPAGATRNLEIKVGVDPLPAVGADHQHLFDVQKTEVHVDVEPGDTATGDVGCGPGYVVSDGSGRIDHVDQGTGALADVHMTANHAVGSEAWRASFVNDATGRAQAKVFAVCVKTQGETVEGHHHDLVVGDVITETHPLPEGRTAVTLNCAAGQTPVQPGYQLDGGAPVPTTYPSGDNGWTFGVVNGPGVAATEGTFSIRCLDDLVSTANGHTHALGLDQVRRTVTVPAGRTAESTLTCADDAKGVVAGYDVDPGLIVLGNDPRPIVRVFKFHNPTNGPLDADLYLLCLANRTERGADRGGYILNTATVATTTPETSTSDNGDSVSIRVDDSPAITPVAPLVVVSETKVAATVRCSTGGGSCKGLATLVAASTQKVDGALVKKGALLAKAAYRMKSGTKATLQLKKTALGQKVLGSKAVKKAQLRIDGTVRTVRVKH